MIHFIPGCLVLARNLGICYKKPSFLHAQGDNVLFYRNRSRTGDLLNRAALSLLICLGLGMIAFLAINLPRAFEPPAQEYTVTHQDLILSMSASNRVARATRKPKEGASAPATLAQTTATDK